MFFLKYLLAFMVVYSVNALDKVNVTVYYETLCPDSIKFITTQLYPTYKVLTAEMNLTLVPYGKANYTGESETHVPQYKCRHGPIECIGDKAHACLLNDSHILEENKMEFVNCTMSTAKKDAPEYPIKQCSESLGHSSDEVLNCSLSDKGALELLKYKNITEALHPPLSSVPFVVFNEKYQLAESKEALYDFKKIFCKYINGTKPEVCNSPSAAISLTATVLPFITLFSVLFFVTK